MMGINDSDRLRFGPYEVDLHTHELWKHGTKLKLMGQPFNILTLLIKRPGRLVTRDELRILLWPGDTFVDFNHGLNVAVKKLRDVLCDSADDPKYIETLPRRGYRFIAEVEIAPISDSPREEIRFERRQLPAQSIGPLATEQYDRAAAAEFTPSIPLTPPSRERSEPTLGRVSLRRGILLSVLAITVAALGVWVFMTLHYRAGFRAKTSIEASTPGAFLPLTNLSDRTSDPAFSPDGTRVAFRRESFVPATSGIWVKQIVGEELIQVTNSGSDSNPVWSPDGRSIAFSRIHERKRTILQVPSTGGATHTLYTSSFVPGRGAIDWSPDGSRIAFTAKGREGTAAIFLFPVAGGSAGQLTSPSPSGEDWGPTFSPDGKWIVFARSNTVALISVDGGEVRRLTADRVRVLGSPVWAPDGNSIIFSAIYGDVNGLWRLPASGGTPEPIRQAGEMVWNPAVSKRGFRLACQVSSSARSIDQLDLKPFGAKPRTLVTAVSGENAGAQLSPDGRKLAFQSDRAGVLDIWISDQNGQNAVQLTAIGTAGAPRWSPDGKQIAFDVGLARDWREPRAIFLVDADGGTPRPLVQDNFSNNVPNWSHDGEWIYFASNRSGNWQVWKIRKSGGSPVQVTKQGGFAASESRDGQYLFYSKHNLELPEIWRVPPGGGYETPIYPGIRPVDWAAWTVLDDGIFFVSLGGDDRPRLNFYDFSRQDVRVSATLDKTPFWLTSTRKGESAIFDQPGQEESHIRLLENFH
jgi:Tol biopolymer transport system component/DNA-binding winged helix-turn-helix (wHTH) protein